MLGVATFIKPKWLIQYPFVFFSSAALLQVAAYVFGFYASGRYYFMPFDVIIPPFGEVLLYAIAFAGLAVKYKNRCILSVLIFHTLAIISLTAVYNLRGFGMVLPLFICYMALTAGVFIKDVNRRIKCISTAIPLILIVVTIVLAPARYLHRVDAFLSGGKIDPYGAGYMQIMTNHWIASSNFIGGTDSLYGGYSPKTLLRFYITDYPIVNIISTTGWILGIFIVLLIAAFAIRLFVLIKQARNKDGYFIIFALGFVLASQLVLPVLMNFNLFPQTGLWLPLIYMRGVGFITHIITIGIVMAMRDGSASIFQKRGNCFYGRIEKDT